MNDKKTYLALAVIVTGFAILAEAWPFFIIGVIYFYASFTHDGRQRKKEAENKIESETWMEEIKEKERIAEIESTKRMAEIEKVRQEKLKKERNSVLKLKT